MYNCMYSLCFALHYSMFRWDYFVHIAHSARMYNISCLCGVQELSGVYADHKAMMPIDRFSSDVVYAEKGAFFNKNMQSLRTDNRIHQQHSHAPTLQDTPDVR